MTTKEKIDYIWDYYKIHIIAGAFILILLISFINNAINNKVYIFDFTMIGTKLNFDKQKEFEDAITKELIGNNPGKKRALTEIYLLSPVNDNKLQLDPPSQQKLTVKLASSSVDVMILDKGNFNNFAKNGIFLNLDKLKGLDLNNFEVENMPKTDKITAGIYGVDVNKDIPQLDKVGFDYKGKIIAIVSNSKHKDLSVKFINWLFDIK